MFVLCLPRKTNLQVKLNLFVVTKPTFHWTIWFLDASSPSNVNVVLPCLRQPLSLVHANAEEEKENDKDAHENDADQNDNDFDSQSDGYESAEGQDACDWKDFEPDEVLTFYVGNLHYNNNCYEVKKAIQEAICLKIRSNYWSNGHSKDIQRRISRLRLCYSVLGLVCVNQLLQQCWNRGWYSWRSSRVQ